MSTFSFSYALWEPKVNTRETQRQEKFFFRHDFRLQSEVHCECQTGGLLSTSSISNVSLA